MLKNSGRTLFKRKIWSFCRLNLVNLLKLPAYLHTVYQCSYKNMCTMLSLFTEFTKEFERN